MEKNRFVYKKRNIRTSDEQFNLMMDFVEQNPILLKGKPADHQRISELWQELTMALNNCNYGSKKTIEGWRKTWIEYKCHVKARHKEILLSRKKIVKKSVKALTHRHERLLDILNKIDMQATQTPEAYLSQSESEPDVKLEPHIEIKQEPDLYDSKFIARSPISIADNYEYEDDLPVLEPRPIDYSNHVIIEEETTRTIRENTNALLELAASNREIVNAIKMIAESINLLTKSI